MYEEGFFQLLYKAMLKRNKEMHGYPIVGKEFVIDYEPAISTAGIKVFPLMGKFTQIFLLHICVDLW